VAKLTEKFDRQTHIEGTYSLELSGEELNLVCLGLLGLRSTAAEAGQWMGALTLNRLMERIDGMVAE
jgi:hypothetical protein